MRKLSSKIRKRIVEDNDVSLDVAKILEIQQYSVKELVRRNSDKLVAYDLIIYFNEVRGYSIQEIFEEDDVPAEVAK